MSNPPKSPIRFEFPSSCDLTEQKALEEQLQRKNRALEETNRHKDEIISKMLHELRTPITTIMGFTEIMYNGEVEGLNEQHEYLGDILVSSREVVNTPILSSSDSFRENDGTRLRTGISKKGTMESYQSLTLPFLKS